MLGKLLQRSIFLELVRVFALALVTLTGLFLLAGLVAEASQRGLAPSQVFAVIPLLVPNTLPYTVPATTLFACCVVYGRLSADNEVVAIKAAGVNLSTIVWPALTLGLLAALGTFALYVDHIPRTHQILRNQVLGDVDDLLLTLLKRNGCLRPTGGKYAMWVREVQGRRLLDVVFKQHGGNGTYKMVAHAQEATIHYDPPSGLVRVSMKSVTTYGENNRAAGYFRQRDWDEPLPPNVAGGDGLFRPSDLTWAEMRVHEQRLVGEVARMQAELQMPPHPEDTPDHYAAVQADRKYQAKQRNRELRNVRAEFQMRAALAFGCLCFALIGAPVGLWFSKADYLSAFVTCFLPVVFAYYPLLLCGMNLAKDGRLPAAMGAWLANATLSAVGLGLLARLLRR